MLIHGYQRKAATYRHGVCSRVKFACEQGLQPPGIDVSVLDYLLHGHFLGPVVRNNNTQYDTKVNGMKRIKD